MMKLLFTLCIAIGLLSPLYAQTTVLFEDFEGATPGTSLDGYNGWSGDANFLISSTTIDQGQSVDCASSASAWPDAIKSFTNTVGAGEYCELTATLFAPAASHDYAHLEIRKVADSDSEGMRVMLGYGELIFAYDTWSDDGSTDFVDFRVAKADVPMDIKAVITDGRTDYYHRLNGEVDWNHAGGIDFGDPSSYEHMYLVGHNGYAGNFDSVNLIKTDGTPGNEAVLLSEDFEGAAPGTQLNGYDGWTGDRNLKYSSTTIDQNQSLEVVSDVDWPSISKPFSYTLGNDECYTLTGTLYAPTTSNDYAHLEINQLGNEAAENTKIMLGYNELIFQTTHEGTEGEEVVMDIRAGQAGTPMDVKMVIQEGKTDCYYRMNGDPDWILLDGEYNTGDGNVGWPSLYDQITMYGHSLYDGGIDTVSLTAGAIANRLPGDANNDGVVDSEDAALLAANWQTLTGATWGMGDFSGDEAVDDIDATILASNWHPGTATASVPEPGTMALLCLGGFLLLLSLRKRSA